MPLVRIDLRKGKDTTYREEIGLIVHDALISVGVPKDDHFQVRSEHEPPNLVFDPAYLGIRRSEDLVMIQITERGPDRRAEEGALQGDRRRACGQARPAPRGRLRQPRRGQT